MPARMLALQTHQPARMLALRIHLKSIREAWLRIAPVLPPEVGFQPARVRDRSILMRSLCPPESDDAQVSPRDFVVASDEAEGPGAPASRAVGSSRGGRSCRQWTSRGTWTSERHGGFGGVDSGIIVLRGFVTGPFLDGALTSPPDRQRFRRDVVGHRTAGPDVCAIFNVDGCDQ